MATEEMQCKVVGCNFNFKMPPIELAMAMQRLALHDKQAHSVEHRWSLSNNLWGTKFELNQTK